MGTEIDKKSQKEVVWLTNGNAASGCVFNKSTHADNYRGYRFVSHCGLRGALNQPSG